jgi:diguanylate cyclase (GGDEF)-like protein
MTSLGYLDLETRPQPTKLWNRSHATRRLADELNRADHDRDYQFSMLLVEFDGLSDITDRLGYASGDDVWQRILGVLMQDLRSNDLCCRLGGDEFLLILSGKGPAECRAVADRLHRRWSPGAGTREATVEVNIGIATYPGHGTTIEALMGTADEAMQSDRIRNDQLRSSVALQHIA